MTIGCVAAGVSGLACTMVDVSGEAVFLLYGEQWGGCLDLACLGVARNLDITIRRGCSGPLPLWSFFVFAASVCFSFVGQAYGARGDTHPGLKILGLHFCFSTLHFRTFPIDGEATCTTITLKHFAWAKHMRCADAGENADILKTQDGINDVINDVM